MKIKIEKDKRMIITLPYYLHKDLKLKSVETVKSMNLLIVEAIKKSLIK
jgi:hypothetical protein